VEMANIMKEHADLVESIEAKRLRREVYVQQPIRTSYRVQLKMEEKRREEELHKQREEERVRLEREERRRRLLYAPTSDHSGYSSATDEVQTMKNSGLSREERLKLREQRKLLEQYPEPVGSNTPAEIQENNRTFGVNGSQVTNSIARPSSRISRHEQEELRSSMNIRAGPNGIQQTSLYRGSHNGNHQHARPMIYRPIVQAPLNANRSSIEPYGRILHRPINSGHEESFRNAPSTDKRKQHFQREPDDAAPFEAMDTTLSVNEYRTPFMAVNLDHDYTLRLPMASSYIDHQQQQNGLGY